MVPAPEPGFPSLPDDAVGLRLNGRATDAQFAQNPIPVLEAMGTSLARFHARSADGLASRTADEVAAAKTAVAGMVAPPVPYDRLTSDQVIALLHAGPLVDRAAVRTHGAPIVSAAVLVDGVVEWDDHAAEGLDPAERDLAITLRSIAETFTSEASAAFLDAYERAGGHLPSSPALDWYALVAAFR
ncbi:MAG: hypothetical protein ACR2P0_14140 [Acidimicrobiales bacterium]